MKYGHWILGPDGEPVPCKGGLLEWARWFEKADRVVAQTRVARYWISTVFLGIDHNFADDGPPLLFETMVFTPEADRGADRWCKRHATRAEAYSHHERVVEALRADWKPDAPADDADRVDERLLPPDHDHKH